MNFRNKKENLILNSLKEAKEKVNKALLANQSLLVYELEKRNFEDFEHNSKINFESICDYNYKDQVINFLKDNKLINHNQKNFNQNIFDEFENEIINFLDSKTDMIHEMKEYYEAWLVDSWLLSKLEEKGGLIINYKGHEQWWGRGCTGQSVTMDYVIQDIIQDLASHYCDFSVKEIKKFLQKIKIPIFNL